MSCLYFISWKFLSFESDGIERYDFCSRFLLLHSPFLFPLFFRREEKRRRSSKNRDPKSYLSVPSSGIHRNFYQNRHIHECTRNNVRYRRTYVLNKDLLYALIFTKILLALKIFTMTIFEYRYKLYHMN